MLSKGVRQIKGDVNSYEVGLEQPVKSILFNIVNLIDYIGLAVRDGSGVTSWAGRSVIEAGEWRITLDKLEASNRIFDELKATGGFGITHVGRIERSDNKKFAPKHAEKLFEALYRYMSFCRGAWVAPILPVGFDENGDRVWEKWRNWKIERWKYLPNWFDAHSVEGLSRGFPGFYQRWQEKNWAEALLLSNHWYVEANMASGGMEGAIILAQAAFELLGWTHLVEERLALSGPGYEDLKAADKLRLLLSICEIPAAIPPSLSELTAKAKGNNWKDGPQAITEVRNALVHSNPAKRKKVFDDQNTIVHETWELSRASAHL